MCLNQALVSIASVGAYVITFLVLLFVFGSCLRCVCGANSVVRPPGTLVPKAFCFSRDVYFFFNQTQDLRAPSADRHETLPRDHYLLRLDNPGRKIRGALP